MSNWDEIVESLRPEMDVRHKARERALATQRQIIQTSSKCIRHIHRHQFDQARELLAEARRLAKDVRDSIAGQPEILYAGYLQDAEKEMVEAAGLLAMILGEPYPTPQELTVEPASYLNGMAEAASECRRFLLDTMRKGNMPEAERLLGLMESVYDDLITFDYPDGMTGGLRRTCDALRAVIERTRSDLTMTLIQSELLKELQSDRPSTHDPLARGRRDLSGKGMRRV